MNMKNPFAAKTARLAIVAAVLVLAAGCAGRQAAQDLAAELKTSAPHVKAETPKFSARDEALVEYVGILSEVAGEQLKSQYAARSALLCERLHDQKRAELYRQQAELAASILNEVKRSNETLETVVDNATQELSRRLDEARGEIESLRGKTGAVEVEKRLDLERQYGALAFTFKSVALRIYRQSIEASNGTAAEAKHNLDRAVAERAGALQNAYETCKTGANAASAGVDAIFDAGVESNKEAYDALEAYLQATADAGDYLERYFRLNSLGSGGVSDVLLKSAFGGMKSALLGVVNKTEDVEAPTKADLKKQFADIETEFLAGAASWAGVDVDLTNAPGLKSLISAIFPSGKRAAENAASEEMKKIGASQTP